MMGHQLTNQRVGWLVFLEFWCKSLLVVVGPWHPGIDERLPFELYKRKDPISYYHIQSEEEEDEWEKAQGSKCVKSWASRDPLSILSLVVFKSFSSEWVTDQVFFSYLHDNDTHLQIKSHWGPWQELTSVTNY
jgi:hypothetical protein